MQIATDAFWVVFSGNKYVSLADAQNGALRRSAEVTLNNGYQYFVIEDRSEVMNKSEYTQTTYQPVLHTRGNVGGQPIFANLKPFGDRG